MTTSASGGRGVRGGRGLVTYAVTLLLAITLNFLLPHAMPGDPLSLIVGNAIAQMNAEQIAEVRAAYGLDRSLPEQYVSYLGRLARGDLGQSYRFSGGRSVRQVVLDRFAWTALLVVTSLTIASVAGTLLGAWAAWHRGGKRDLGLLTLLFTLRSIPVFWLAMILIPPLALGWNLVPVGDSYSFPRQSGWRNVVDIAHHALLPILVLTVAYLPTVFAITRASMLSEVGKPYVRAARAKGVPERGLLYRHTLRNALLPVITVVALDLGQLLGGVLLIETVFNYRGLGSMMFEAVKSRDYPLLQGGFLLFTVVVLALNLLADALYSRLDPRARRGGT